MSSLVAIPLAFVLLGAPDPRPTPPPAKGAPKPAAAPKAWAVGVSPAQRAEALKRFEAGNHFFGKLEYARAIHEYRRAVRSWDHPSIRYNMTVCLINLGRPVAAYRSLERALRYGRGPLSAGNFRRAKSYRKLLLERLARVEIVAEQPGVQVTLDREKILAAGSRRATRLVVAGKHQLVASRPKFATLTQTVFLLSGRKTVITIKLVQLGGKIKYKRRWQTSLPWVIAGGGVVMTAVGLAFYFVGKARFKKFDKEVANNPECANGCQTWELPDGIGDLPRKGKTMRDQALALIPAGSVLMAASIFLWILNRPRPVKDDKRSTLEISGVRILPSVGPRGGMVTAALRF